MTTRKRVTKTRLGVSYLTGLLVFIALGAANNPVALRIMAFAETLLGVAIFSALALWVVALIFRSR